MKSFIVYQPGYYEEGTILGVLGYYEEGTILGVFSTFNSARSWVESQDEYKHFSLGGIEIQEWEDTKLVKSYDRKRATPMQWDEHTWMGKN